MDIVEAQTDFLNCCESIESTETQIGYFIVPKEQRLQFTSPALERVRIDARNSIVAHVQVRKLRTVDKHFDWYSSEIIATER